MKPEVGTWILISPTGIEFKAESPINCIKNERNARVPPEEIIVNIDKFLSRCDLCEDAKICAILGKGTPAEIRVCATCKDAILSTTLSETL